MQAGFFGAKLPKPVYIDLNNTLEVAEWVAGSIRDHSGCTMATYPSSAVRLCHAASEKGLDIRGLKIVVVGEPLTDEAKKKEIRSAGVDILTSYGFTEAGIIGYGCATPVESDDLHFFNDSFALIQYKRRIPYGDHDINAFLFTNLLQSSPKILLNVETGDYGVIGSRKCGCVFERFGFHIHLHNIRSFGKFTSEGMNLAGDYLMKMVEETLPLKYGGLPTDYQIIEEEDEEGFTRMSIVVSPKIGEIEESDILETVLDTLKAENETGLMPDIFSQANTFRIKRAYPVPSERGKVFSLHTTRKR